jgi:hypothetical protein
LSEQPIPFTAEELDAALYAVLSPRRQKLAMIAAKVMMANRQSVTESMIDEAFARLAQRSDVETFGNISNWRFSEICLKSV